MIDLDIKPTLILDAFKIENESIYLKKFHILRTDRALRELGSTHSAGLIENIYNDLESKFKDQKNMKIRLVFNPENIEAYEISTEEIEKVDQPIKLSLAKKYFQISGVGLQNYKTSLRDYWDKVLKLKPNDCFDVVGINQDDDITETSRFNIFLLQKNIFYTPALESGCVNGTLRQFYLSDKRIEHQGKEFPLEEKNINYNDLTKYDLYVGNSIRGLLPAELIKV